MPEFTPRDPQFATRIRASFARQKFMAYLGARLTVIEPGFCEIRLQYREELSQQHGFFHAGVVSTLADNSAGYAAYSLMEAEASILSVEYKINLLAPGAGEALIARSRVVKSGRTLTVCSAEVFAATDDDETLCASALLTMIRLAQTSDEVKYKGKT